MKNLLGFIVLFIIAAIVLTLVQYFQKPRANIIPLSPAPLVSTTTSTEDKNPLLSPTQEAALENLGIEPATLSKIISSAMQTCFEAKLGLQRVNEIKAGSLPTKEEALSARSCLDVAN